MSIHAPLPPPPATLEALLRQAGGVLATRDGRPVVTSFGSAAGELAACVSAVGLADCSQLTKLVVEGPAALLRALTRHLTGAELAPGGAASTGTTWWCAPSAQRVVVLGEPAGGPDGPDGPDGPGGASRLAAVVRAAAARHPGVTVSDHTADWAALAVAGRRAPALLAALGIYGASGDPRTAAPVAVHHVGQAAALWLLASDTKAVAVLPRASAAGLWRAIERAGRGHGLCAVGQEALARYELIRPCARL